MAQDGIYYYLLIKNKELNKYDDLLLKITQEKELREIESLKSRGNALKENFTDDSDEFVAYKNDYNLWKQNIIPSINKWFETDDQLKDNYFTNELNYENEKQILIRMLECEYLLDDNSPFRFKIPKYKRIIGDKSPTKEIPGYEPSEDNGVVSKRSDLLPPSEVKEKQEEILEEESKALLPSELDKKEDITPGGEEDKKEDISPGEEDLPPEEVEDKKEDITPGGDDINLPKEEAQYMEQEEQEKKEDVENEYKDEEMYVDNEEKSEQKVDKNNNDLAPEEEKKEENAQSEVGTNENLSEKNATKYTGNFY